MMELVWLRKELVLVVHRRQVLQHWFLRESSRSGFGNIPFLLSQGNPGNTGLLGRGFLSCVKIHSWGGQGSCRADVDRRGVFTAEAAPVGTKPACAR